MYAGRNPRNDLAARSLFGLGCESGVQDRWSSSRKAGRGRLAAKLAGALDIISVDILRTLQSSLFARDRREGRGYKNCSDIGPVRRALPAQSLSASGSDGAVLVSGLLRSANSLRFMVCSGVVHLVVAEHS